MKRLKMAPLDNKIVSFCIHRSFFIPPLCLCKKTQKGNSLFYNKKDRKQ